MNYNHEENFIELFYKYNMNYQTIKLYLFKAYNKNTRGGCEICPQSAIKIPEQF